MVRRRRYRWRHRVRTASRREAARAEIAPSNRPPGYALLGGRALGEARTLDVERPLLDRSESGKIAPSRRQRSPTAAGTAAKQARRSRSGRAKPSSLAATSRTLPRPASQSASGRGGRERPRQVRHAPHPSWALPIARHTRLRSAPDVALGHTGWRQHQLLRQNCSLRKRRGKQLLAFRRTLVLGQTDAFKHVAGRAVHGANFRTVADQEGLLRVEFDQFVNPSGIVRSLCAPAVPVGRRAVDFDPWRGRDRASPPPANAVVGAQVAPGRQARSIPTCINS